jgi:phosphosulfolactate phosphohydrolase-like enzyme
MRSSRVYTREAEDKRDMYERLEDTEVSIVNYVAQDQGIAYSNLKESRDKEELSSQTVSRDLRYTTQTQAIMMIVAVVQVIIQLSKYLFQRSIAERQYRQKEVKL